jgi:hypothetical protein
MLEDLRVWPRAFRAGLLVSSGALLLSVGPVLAPTQATSLPVIVRIEEDWEMRLNDPAAGMSSPQFHTVMSPDGSLGGKYAQVLWNYRETPDYRPGGVQLQCYEGDSLVRSRTVESRSLSTVAEVIRWTQALSTDGTQLTLQVFDGTSTTWGTFGNDMRLDESTSVSTLAGYDPQHSVTSSGVTYGSNRVDLLVITAVRYYTNDGLFAVDPTVRTVYEWATDE